MKLLNALFICAAAFTVQATDLDTIGVTLLRQVDSTLNGSFVRVAQIEAPYFTTPLPPYAFEVIPSGVGQPTNRFTYYSDLGTATTYPNSVGVNSDHADSVAGNFYGIAGVATNVAHVDNYEVNHFLNFWPVIPGRVANQSWNYGTNSASVEQTFDNYSVNRNTIFVSGAGNGGPIFPPASCFNGITVGDYSSANSCIGPTPDGRCKPDLTAPPSNSVTSFSTPYVSGAATLLVQAAARGDGGAGASAATNLLAIKALLLNGAIKPADWTNGPVTPLDARYGAGIVNVFNSWKQLKGGLRASNETTTITSGSAHPPGASTGNQLSLIGWDHNATLSTATANQDKIIHYYFNLTNSNPYTFTATLVWNRQNNQAAINNLDLFLYNTGNSNLVLSSTSAVDNVEHLFLPQLAPGRYDLQVLKHRIGQVSNSETYALAFEFFCMKLNLALTNGSALLSWTNSPTGFRLVSADSLSAPAVWTTVGVGVTMTNGQNIVSVPVSGTNQFFRLQRP